MTKKLKFQTVIEEFLSVREWEDELNVNKEARSVVLATAVNIGEYSGGKLIIEASDETEVVAVFFYLPFECKDAKRSEMTLLLNELNTRGATGGYGCLQLIDDARIRWVQKVDFEGSSPSGKSIEQMVGPGWQRCSAFIEAIRSVAVTKKSASQALEEFDSPDQ
jgi:hypothetical protein